MGKLDPARLGELLELARQGLTSGEIVRRTGLTRMTVLKYRRAANLPASAECIRKARAANGKANMASLGKSPNTVARDRLAASRGWPVGLSTRSVSVVEVLCDLGPQTKESLSALLGVKNFRTKDKTILGELVGAGLIHRAHKALRQGGRCVSLYFPTQDALEIRRKFLQEERERTCRKTCDD